MGASGPVWLVGMMGAGKSSVGAALAARLGRAFVDSDAEIAREAGATIPEIFSAEGEAGFRRRERAVVARCASGEAVVALGGGAVAEPATAALVTRVGTMVYLRARPETLLARVGESDSRPLLAGLDPAGRLARLRELARAREAAYAVAAIQVETDARSEEDVVETIVEQLGGTR